jgi:glycosyltransferase involved in cell wall biosynthesis
VIAGAWTNILWYWPFARPEEVPLAEAVAALGNVHVTVLTIDRDAAPGKRSGPPVTVNRALPDVAREVGTVRWIASRAATYAQRARIRRAIERSHNFDLVHDHYLNRFTDPWRRPPATWVLSVHDVFPHQPRLSLAAERHLLNRLYRRPDALVVHHSWVRERLLNEFELDASRVHVVPLQVLRVPRPTDTQPPAGRPRVLWFGAMRPNKGLNLLAATIESPGAKQFDFHIAGRGERDLERLARSLAERFPNVTAEVGFVPLERKHELFRSASVVVLPYTSFESQSAVLHDAYGHGRPVVVTEVGALGVTVRSDGTGVVVAPEPAELLAGLSEAASGWERFARQATDIAEQRSPEQCARSLLRVYESLR